MKPKRETLTETTLGFIMHRQVISMFPSGVDYFKMSSTVSVQSVYKLLTKKMDSEKIYKSTAIPHSYYADVRLRTDCCKQKYNSHCTKI